MKIDEPKLSNLNQLATNQEKPKVFAFEQWLNNLTKPKTGDEYYWLHQQQLQNSALQFRLSKQDGKNEALELSLSTPKTCQQSNCLVEIESTRLSKKGEADRQSWSAYSLENEFPQVIKLITILITQCIAEQISSLNQCQLQTSRKPAPLSDRLLARQIIFKNYQLFIEAKEAEISLNSAGLNKQQIKELSQYLKHWLLNKGIQLQQLVINGVKQ